MATVFICYASEDRDTAESIQLALRSAGHGVFFDKDSLPPSGITTRGYREPSTAATSCIPRSAASLTDGSYALTELRFARERWPDPVNYVLPVAIGRLANDVLPAYLRAVTLLGVEGNPAVEVRAAIISILRPRVVRRARLLVLTASCVAVLAGGTYRFRGRGWARERSSTAHTAAGARWKPHSQRLQLAISTTTTATAADSTLMATCRFSLVSLAR
jgi:hypothetical protein